MLSEDDALQFLIENGADEELLTKLGYHNAINGTKNINANIIDFVINKCKNNKALLAGALALLISTGQLFGYEVQKKDTLWRIATNAGCKVEDIYKLNPGLKNKPLIKPGMNLVLPNEIKNINNNVDDDFNSNNNIYIVQKNDTKSGIASMFGMKISELERLNPQLKKQRYLQIGQKINVGNHKKVAPIYRTNTHEKLNIDAAVEALRDVETNGGINNKPGDGGKAIGEFQLWEIFVKDYHELGGKKQYQCHVVNGVAQPDDVRWDADKCEEMIRFVLKKRGYRNMEEIILGYSEYNGRNNVKYPGWNGGVNKSELKKYVDAYKNRCK